jgi:uncharacterized membrane protein
MPRKKRAYESYNWTSVEARYCVVYLILAIVAIVHNIGDRYPTMPTKTPWVVAWSVIGLGTFAAGIHLRKGPIRNRFLGSLLVIFSLVLIAFALLLSFYHPQLID